MSDFDESKIIYEDEVVEYADFSDVCYEADLHIVNEYDEVPVLPPEVTPVAHDTFKEVSPDVEPKEYDPFVLCKIRGKFAGPYGVLNGNSRVYLPSVRDAILNSPYINGMIANKCLLGEATHPESKRGSIMLTESCICITKLWPEGDYLMGEAEVINTPNGRIVHDLLEHGCHLGVSCRAGGKAVKGTYNGQRGDIIKPENYDLRTFDVVLNPGFKECRPAYVPNYEEGLAPQTDMEESMYSVFKNIIEEGKTDTKLIRDYIDYCDDESLKSLLPMLEETTDFSDDTSSTVKELSEENSRLSRLVDALREEIFMDKPNADSLVEELFEEIKTLKNSLEESKRRSEDFIDSILGQLEISDQALTKTEEENTIKDDRIRQLVENSESLQASLKDLGFQVEQFQARVTDLEEENAELQAKNEELQSLIYSLRKTNEGLTEELEAKTVVREERPALVIQNRVDLFGGVSEVVEDVINEESEASKTRRSLINSIRR